MDPTEEIRAVKAGICEMLTRTNEYAILNLIYEILIESNQTLIEPPLSA